MLKFISDFKLILYNPFLIKKENNKLIILKYFMITLVLFSLGILFSIIIHKLLDTQRPYNGNINKITFLKSVVFVPIIEEFIFRAIQKRNKRNIMFFISGVLSLVSLLYFKNMAVYYQIILFLISIILSFIYFFKISKKTIKPFTNKQSIYIIYLSSIIFGLMHIITFKVVTIQTILPLVIVNLPKILDGFILSFLRFKFGLFYSVLFHVLINLIPFMVIQFR